MPDISIRTATIVDLQDLIVFNQAMALESENRKLNEATLRSGVKRVLDDRNQGFYLVAIVDGKVTGSLMVTFEWSDWRNAQYWWIQSVYILPEYRRQGIYRTLYQAVKNRGNEQQGIVCKYRLYVEKDNFIAQKAYKQLGMNESNYLMYESINNQQLNHKLR
ncbi:MAG: GNAT family N-acetyltransferase [Endozoicomonas sp.]